MKISIHATEAEIAALPEFARWYHRPAFVLVVDHERTDDKGRALGGLANVYQIDDGRYFCRVYPTRNGARFGATPPSRFLGTDLETAKAEARRKLEDQGKRYAKLAGGAS